MATLNGYVLDPLRELCRIIPQNFQQTIFKIIQRESFLVLAMVKRGFKWEGVCVFFGWWELD